MALYNHQDYVAQALQSVLDQTLADWELIVVDDGSTDRSRAIVADFARADSRIRVRQQKNAGPARARNAAAAVARSPWLTYLDSDDIWFPQALAEFHDYLSIHPNARFIYGHYYRLEGARIEHLQGEYQHTPTGTRELFQRVFLNPMCVCHCRELWDAVNGFDVSLRCCEDYDLFLRMSLHCHFEPIGRPIGLRRRHGSNLSRQTGRSQEVEAAVLRRFVERGGQNLLDPGVIRQRLSTVYYRAARQFLKEGRYLQTREMARQAHRFQSSWKGTMVGWAGWLLGTVLSH
jgi:glycosyltransferase involved in cell wall biosynthesis